MELLQDLEAGLRVSDTRFDKVFPVEARAQAHIHWTEVATALEAVDLLTRERDEPVRILDVGSNVGKFCLVGALASRAEFVGVERRRPLVDIARSVARRLRVPRVRYQWADMESIDWSTFNGIYLYNPFQENIEPEIKIDGELELSLAQYARYVSVVQAKLTGCAPGTRVVTYYGFGGPFPEGYERSAVETQNPRLKLWVRV